MVLFDQMIYKQEMKAIERWPYTVWKQKKLLIKGIGLYNLQKFTLPWNIKLLGQFTVLTKTVTPIANNL